MLTKTVIIIKDVSTVFYERLNSTLAFLITRCSLLKHIEAILIMNNLFVICSRHRPFL